MAMTNSTTKRFSSTSADTNYADKINEMIRKKAFELSQRRGGKPGKELDDWLEAERLVKKEMSMK